MSETMPSVLLITHDSETVESITDMLMEVMKVTSMGLFDDALQHLRSEPCDVIIMDFLLPGISGVPALEKLREACPRHPVVILMESDQNETALAALKAGARDFCIKKNLTGVLLRHVIKRVTLLQSLSREHEETIEKEAREHELQGLERLSSLHHRCIASRVLGIADLSEALPGPFEELVNEYEASVRLAMDERFYRLDHNVASKLRELGDCLGMYRAGPRDVMDIHIHAMSKIIRESTTQQKFQTCIDEGRVALARLMGYLTLFYRNMSLYLNPPSPCGRGKTDGR
ncbi:MAG: response regulator [Candidatus Eremiobacteraeota bacterium]|nr:response regulator [Candidatus Eremiobacteraeota bacterium]